MEEWKRGSGLFLSFPHALELLIWSIDFQIAGIETKIDRLRRQDILTQTPIKKV